MNIPKKGSIIVAILLFCADQISKFLVLENIGTSEIIYVASNLNFTLTFNAGVTFGLLKAYSNLHFILLVVGVCIMSIVVAVWWFRAENSIQRYATAMILAGAFGNLVDRLRFHSVVDFIDFHFLGYHWYTFNIADSAIVIGVGLLFVDNLYKAKIDKRNYKSIIFGNFPPILL
jgi:signal peptidase II